MQVRRASHSSKTVMPASVPIAGLSCVKPVEPGMARTRCFQAISPESSEFQVSSYSLMSEGFHSSGRCSRPAGTEPSV